MLKEIEWLKEKETKEIEKLQEIERLKEIEISQEIQKLKEIEKEKEKERDKLNEMEKEMEKDNEKEKLKEKEKEKEKLKENEKNKSENAEKIEKGKSETSSLNNEQCKKKVKNGKAVDNKPVYELNQMMDIEYPILATQSELEELEKLANTKAHSKESNKSKPDQIHTEGMDIILGDETQSNNVSINNTCENIKEEKIINQQKIPMPTNQPYSESIKEDKNSKKKNKKSKTQILVEKTKLVEKENPRTPIINYELTQSQIAPNKDVIMEEAYPIVNSNLNVAAIVPHNSKNSVQEQSAASLTYDSLKDITLLQINQKHPHNEVTNEMDIDETFTSSSKEAVVTKLSISTAKENNIESQSEVKGVILQENINEQHKEYIYIPTKEDHKEENNPQKKSANIMFKVMRFNKNIRIDLSSQTIFLNKIILLNSK